MSQSDYIQRKRMITQVYSKNNVPMNKIDNPPILSSQLFTEIKRYDLENTIINTIPQYNQLIPNSSLVTLNMDLKRLPESCNTYRTCNEDEYNSSSLPNRVPVTMFYNFALDIPFADPPTMSPYRGTKMFSLNSGHSY